MTRPRVPDNPAIDEMQEKPAILEGEQMARDHFRPPAPAEPPKKKRTLDPVLSTLGKIERLLENLNQNERQRIIHWLGHEYHCAAGEGLPY